MWPLCVEFDESAAHLQILCALGDLPDDIFAYRAIQANLVVKAIVYLLV